MSGFGAGDGAGSGSQSTTSSSSASASTASQSPVQSTSATTSAATTVASGATTASSAAEVSSNSSHHPSYGVPISALAGAIVGCILGAALITFILTFLFMRKRMDRVSASRGVRRESGSSRRRGSSKGQLLVSEKPMSNSEDAAQRWQTYLPQPADDRTIQNQVKILFDQIELHVDNYYRKANVEMDDSTRQALLQLDTGELPLPIVDLAQNPRMALSVIKHCIAGLLVKRMTPEANSFASLLPRHLSETPTKLRGSHLRSDERKAAEQAYSHWRLLSSYLYPKPEDDRAYVKGRDAVAKQISQQLSTAFSPWVAADTGTLRNLRTLQQHESSLITTAGTVGILLASQPFAYDFHWTEGNQQSSSSQALTILPGLWKTSDEEGRLLERPQLVVSPVTVRK